MELGLETQIKICQAEQGQESNPDELCTQWPKVSMRNSKPFDETERRDWPENAAVARSLAVDPKLGQTPRSVPWMGALWGSNL